MKQERDQFGRTISPSEKSERYEFALRVPQDDGTFVDTSVEQTCREEVPIDIEVNDPTRLRDAGVRTNVVTPNSQMKLDDSAINEVNEFLGNHASALLK